MIKVSTNNFSFLKTCFEMKINNISLTLIIFNLYKNPNA